MTVSDLCEKMPYTEFVGWMAYFRRRPAGWQEDSRTYTLLSAQGVKAKPEEIFSTLAQLRESEQNERTQADALKSSGFLKFLQATAIKNNVNWELEDDKN